MGLPLAKQLVKKGYSVKGSTTTESKLELLEKEGISPFLISLKTAEIQRDIVSFLENSGLLIINIPPGLGNNPDDSFVAKMEYFIPFIEKSSVEKVIFVSSTSVYADENNLVTEETFPKPETESGKQLVIVEKLLSENKNFQTTILRFGGLIGEDRHPVKFLAGRNNIKNPEAPINLIHQSDCIEIIQKIIRLRLQKPFSASLDKYGKLTDTDFKSAEYDIIKKRGLDVLNISISTPHIPDAVEEKIIAQWKSSWLINARIEKELVDNRRSYVSEEGKRKALETYVLGVSNFLGSQADRDNLSGREILRDLVRGSQYVYEVNPDLHPLITDEIEQLRELMTWVEKNNE